MKHFLLAIFLIGNTLFTWSQQKQPKLVVGIVVDQMRYDYLTRFWEKFSENGFKKLVNNGFNCEQTHFNYMPTYTAPGHASIYTGTTPANHGIIANTWYDKTNKAKTYCTSDENVQSVGTTTNMGKMSPNKLLVTTIADELKTANKQSKVIGISIKDRGAILPAGYQADAAYWFAGEDEGKWISSTYYMKQLPKWLNELNEKNTANTYLQKPWKTLLPIHDYTESIADNNPYEEVFEGEKAPIFPHNLPALRKANKNYDLIKSTPFGNTILKELAFEVIQQEKLGADAITDLLTVSFSSPDYIGHQFGPYSVEIEDTYLRLDREIAELLTFLEKQVGEGEFLVFLTADHGVVDIPQHAIDNKLPGGYFEEKATLEKMNTFLFEKFNVENLVENLSNYQLFFNHDLIAEHQLNLIDIENFAVNFMLKQEGIVKAVSATSMKSAEFDSKILANVQRGFHQVRSGDVMFVLASGWINKWTKKGTTHGSPYNYDTHVPLLWYGTNIKQGVRAEQVAIADIAATLSVLLKIALPSACDGKVIEELVK
ncbi:MAG: alkaline phosphatase [Flavobacteriales bacterium]|nr:alkaline phosphatase [Flavobacteriales bacterium]|tara:strand:+ start:67870 stop:69495 length:1626 start_codon:yes stop_codon:yes gene_type:complete